MDSLQQQNMKFCFYSEGFLILICSKLVLRKCSYCNKFSGLRIFTFYMCCLFVSISTWKTTKTTSWRNERCCLSAVTFYCQGFRLYFWLKHEALDCCAPTSCFRQESPPSLHVSNCNSYFTRGDNSDSGLAYRHRAMRGFPIIKVRMEVTAQKLCAIQSPFPCRQRGSCLLSCVA